MEDDALDLLADLEEVNQFLGQADIEFFYESGNMSCPIEGCNQDVKGRTLYRNIDQAGPIQEEQAGPSNQEEQAGPSNQEERAGPCNPQEQAGPCTPQEQAGPCTPQEQAGSSNPQEQAGPCTENEAGTDAQEPMEVLHALSTASTNEGETQTCCLDYPQLYIPVCPDTIEGAESHIMWFCNVMDQVGRARELAKRKIEEMRQQEGPLEEERRKRVALEQENRELKRQIEEMTWRRSVLFEE
ncbi:hypothetical protein FSP39_019247 [Pinctada imbricata]|uniref:Uncharacterized protein n=1 Tax=Pinctada imbricata TaxID=66713 RepID=A0AA88YM57_PINIB|nr:hypothetical protein FSP39_019247 [Pinctada imbricata]